MAYLIKNLVFDVLRRRVFHPFMKVAIAIIICVLPAFSAFSQTGDEEEIPIDEISVTLDVKGVGAIESPALYQDRDLYLSITGVFDFIKIRNIPYKSYDSIKGFFINEQDSFLIDKPNERIFYKGKVFDVSDHGLLRSESGLYLNLKYFKTIFGLDGSFYFRRLVVALSSDAELPAIKDARLALMRKNASGLKGEVVADSTIKRTHPLFHFGMADWAVMSSQQSQGGDQTNVNLSLGAVLAGGELNTSFNYYSRQAFTEKLQFYQWRYVDNENAAVKQVALGKIFTQSTATLYAPVVGAQVTNTATTYKKAYGSYSISNTTEPGWIVELYVNDVLIDYKKANAAGFYTFDVPLIYGFTIVKLKFYGPYGETRTSQQYVNIPFSFVKPKAFEYSVNGGIVEDGKDSKFAKVNMKYGISSHVTIGGGNEYLSSVQSGEMMPFVNTTMRLAPRLLLSGEYAHTVRSRAILSYRMPKGLQYELDYTKYSKGQTAIFYNFLEERKAIVSVPLHAKRVSLFARLTLDQIVLPSTQYTNSELSFTGFAGRIGFNLSTFTSFIKTGNPYFYSVASITAPLPKKVLLTGQIQYDHKANYPVFTRLSLEKNIYNKGFVSFSYQEYFNTNNRNFLLGMRYDLSFAKAALSMLSGTNKTYSRIQAASGSLVIDRKSGYAKASNRTSVSKGGVAISPYLDLNFNGVRDAGEPRVNGLKIKINGGRIVYDEQDSMVRVLDLEPYNNYYVQLVRNSFDNISWHLRNETFNVSVNANNFTFIEIPISVVGEVAGTVFKKDTASGEEEGQRQIVVGIYDAKGNLVARTVSEFDGYFNYLGITSGTYTVRIDPKQLEKIGMKSEPEARVINIKNGKDGDVADGLDFLLLPR